MVSVLSIILKNTSHISTNKDVPLFSLSYISDYDLKLNDELIQIIKENLENFLEQYDLKELSYLLVALKS
jgi:hypothetical protein